jgi:hypothetical protein
MNLEAEGKIAAIISLVSGALDLSERYYFFILNVYVLLAFFQVLQKAPEFLPTFNTVGYNATRLFQSIIHNLGHLTNN